MKQLPQVTLTDLTCPTAIIKLREFYHPGLEHERFALYEATRAHWSLHENKKLTKVKRVLAVHDNIVLEVYEVAAWIKANTTMMYFRMDKGEHHRVEFVGEIAKEPIRSRFRGKSVASIITPQSSHSVICFGPNGRKEY